MSYHNRSWILVACFLAVAVLFYFANRSAYHGYFSDDDFENLGWPTRVGNDVYYNALVTPKLEEFNFRPFAFLYYRFMGRAFKLHYGPYVVVLQIFHGLNVILLFLVLGRLGFSQVAAGAGALFYSFHAGVLEAYWKPMFVFDLICCSLCLVTLLLYVRGRWLLALIPFWLGYKSKEIAVMLPFALLAWEWLLGGRKWKRLIPYFLISLTFGVQGLWHNRSVLPGMTYALRFTPETLIRAVGFYSSAILFLPYLWVLLLCLPWLVRDRRLYVGMSLMVAIFIPLLFLPGRMNSVYAYAPLTGLAIALAAIASRTPRWTIALFFVLWFPLNYAMMRDKRRVILAAGEHARWYTTGLLEYSRHVPPLKAVVYQNVPPYMGAWGVQGAIHQVFGYNVSAVWDGTRPEVQQATEEVPMAFVGYYPVPHTVKGLLRTRNEPSSYIRFTDEIPNYQFGAGWDHDWGVQGRIATQAEIALYRPLESREFEIVATSGGGPAKVTVLENDNWLGTRMLADSRVQPLRWKLSGANPGVKKIIIQTNSGIAVQSIGYVPAP